MDVAEIKKDLKDFYNKNCFYGLVYILPIFEFDNDEMLIKIHTLFRQDIVNPDCTDESYLCFVGLYYDRIKHNYELAKKYYRWSIRLGSIDAIIIFANYYEIIEQKYHLAKKYYLMAINRGSIDAILDLINFHETVQKDNKLVIGYYLLAIKRGSTIAMNGLGYYYETVDKSLSLAKKYYSMAALRGNTVAAQNLKRLSDT